MKAALILVVLSLLTTVTTGEEARTWTAKSGRTVEAVLVEEEGEFLHLETTDGKKFKIAVDALSSGDVAYVNAIHVKAAEEQERRTEEQERREKEARRELFKPSSMSIAEFHATRPERPLAFAVKASLSDYFNYEFAEIYMPKGRDVYWSVKLSTRGGSPIGYGYILKEGRGNALFEIIRDGREHDLVVLVAYLPKSQDSSVFLLLDFELP